MKSDVLDQRVAQDQSRVESSLDTLHSIAKSEFSRYLQVLNWSDSIPAEANAEWYQIFKYDTVSIYRCNLLPERGVLRLVQKPLGKIGLLPSGDAVYIELRNGNTVENEDYDRLMDLGKIIEPRMKKPVSYIFSKK